MLCIEFAKLKSCLNFGLQNRAESPHVRGSRSHVRKTGDLGLRLLEKRHVRGLTAARAETIATRATHAEKLCLLRFMCLTL